MGVFACVCMCIVYVSMCIVYVCVCVCVRVCFMDVMCVVCTVCVRRVLLVCVFMVTYTHLSVRFSCAFAYLYVHLCLPSKYPVPSSCRGGGCVSFSLLLINASPPGYLTMISVVK